MEAQAKKPAAKKHYDVIRPKPVKRKPKKAVAAPPPEPPKQPSAWQTLEKWLRTPVFARIFMLAGVAVLAASTILWSYLGARIQSANADQLIDPYLFRDPTTFKAAQFPGTHTFLLKWPLFVLINLLGGSDRAYLVMTMLVSLATVGALAYVLYRIERRPLVFGVLCLMLASALLLVPAQPYAGAILPVNMAMLTTRNLEYIVYIAAIAAVFMSSRVRSWRFLAGVALLTVVMASDRLFLTMSIVAAAGILGLYAVLRRRAEVVKATRFTAAAVLAGAASAALLAGLKATHVTGIANGAAATPYAIVHSLHQALVGAIFAVLGLFTNFSANPGYDATQFRQVPHVVANGLASVSGAAYVVNGVILLAGFFAVYRIIARTVKPANQEAAEPSAAGNIALALIMSALAAAGMFVLTNHYYAVDARYLTIALFAVFVSLATYARQRVWRRKHLLTGALVLLGAIGLGVPGLLTMSHDQRAAYASTSHLNSLVTQVISQHHVRTLVGNYWRVVPIQQAVGKDLTVLPLANCTQPTPVLTSLEWKQGIATGSFAYLLSVNKGLTDFPACSYSQIVRAFGRPNSSVLISGTFAKPNELVLFYDHGTRGALPLRQQKHSGLSKPLTLDKMPKSICATSTVLTIVAHQDDDLLFTSPDLVHDVRGGKCIRTVYITAGDAGQGRFYWVNREQASEAAYDEMAGAGKRSWEHRVVSLSANEYVTMANPVGNTKLCLVFMHLPDGNINGRGFHSSQNESLQKLADGEIPTLNSVDGQSAYSSRQMTDALQQLMTYFNPAEIHTQSPIDKSNIYPDHSDHLAVGRYTMLALEHYRATGGANPGLTATYYIGYPTHEMEQNVFGSDLEAKENAFFAYGRFDGGVCRSVEQCRGVPTYNSYLSRQYTVPDVSGAPVPVE